MDTIDKVVVDGYTYWRVTPIDEVPQAYNKLAFNPSIWGMIIALFSVALWLALDLIFQVHITFRRWGGVYYWTVLITSIGIGLHAASLTVKAFTVLTIAQDIGTTVLVKTGDVLTQTGFSLVLYSRLNLIMRTQKQVYLKWILILILVGSFLTHTPTIIITLGVNTRSPGWFQHARVAEKFVVAWFTVLELSLSTIYTYNTARMMNESSVLLNRGALKHQSKKTRRNLLFFMIFAQIVTFTFDMTLVVLVILELSYKAMFMPVFYGIKLKVEFMALNQLQSLVQPNSNMFVFTGDSSPANQPRQRAAKDGDMEGAGIAIQSPVDEDQRHLCPRCGSSSDDPASPVSKESELIIAPEHNNAQAGRQGLQGPVVQISHVSSTGSISELERQYLGRNNK